MHPWFGCCDSFSLRVQDFKYTYMGSQTVVGFHTYIARWIICPPCPPFLFDISSPQVQSMANGKWKMFSLVRFAAKKTSWLMAVSPHLPIKPGACNGIAKDGKILLFHLLGRRTQAESQKGKQLGSIKTIWAVVSGFNPHQLCRHLSLSLARWQIQQATLKKTTLQACASVQTNKEHFGGENFDDTTNVYTL